MADDAGLRLLDRRNWRRIRNSRPSSRSGPWCAWAASSFSPPGTAPMRKVFRNEHNQAYWDRRWAEAGRDGESFASLDIYPVRYAEMIMDRAREPVLELGSGLGRRGQALSPPGQTRLRPGAQFTAIRALAGTRRRLHGPGRRPGPALCRQRLWNGYGLRAVPQHRARPGPGPGRDGPGPAGQGRLLHLHAPDNLEMRLNERYWRWRSGGGKNQARLFHKWLVGEEEFARVLAGQWPAGGRPCTAPATCPSSTGSRFSDARRTESENRSRGYRLNALGEIMDRALTGIAPGSFCNVLVFLGVKDVSDAPRHRRHHPGRRTRHPAAAPDRRQAQVPGPYQGRPILEHLVACFHRCGIFDLTLVTGYAASGPGSGVCRAPQPPFRLHEHDPFPVLRPGHAAQRGRDLLRRHRLPARGARGPAARPPSLAVTVDLRWRELWERRIADPLADAETLRMARTAGSSKIGGRPRCFADIQASTWD